MSRLVASALVALMSVLTWAAVSSFRDAEMWEQRAVEAIADADSARTETLRMLARADSIQVEAEAAAEEAELARQANRVAVREVLGVAPPDDFPAEHLPLIEQRDSVIIALVEEAEGWRSAFHKQIQVTALLRGALSGAMTSNDSLRAVLEDRPRPGFSIIPEIRPGLFTGYCQGDGLCAGAGITLSWDLP